MWLMTQRDEPNDFVIATGNTHSVKDFVTTALEIIGLSSDIDKYVEFDKKLIRPSEVESLIGDNRKAKRDLKWEPKTSFRRLIEIMIENDLKIENQS
jgi:GDPmannose 4,6-dehydratase